MNPAQKATHNNKRKQGRNQQEIAFRVLGGLEEPSDEISLAYCERIAARVGSTKRLLRVLNREGRNMSREGYDKLKEI